MTNTAQQPGISFGPGTGGMPAIGAPTPAPIHDIVGPLPFFATPLWVIALIIAAVALIGLGLRWFLLRRKAVMLTPREKALLELGKLRGRVSEGNDHDFGVGVSDVLRRFLGEAFGLAAPRQTTEEFLASLGECPRFVPAEREAMAEFLHRADYLKYARGEATSEQRLALILAAESFVRIGDSAKKGDSEAAASGKEGA